MSEIAVINKCSSLSQEMVLGHGSDEVVFGFKKLGFFFEKDGEI
jgi:hypothetical protein